MENGAATTRANGRASSNQFQVKTEGRKPLFAKEDSQKDEKPDLARYRPPGANEGNARRTSSQATNHGRTNSESVASNRRDSNASMASTPGGTRIAKPHTHRKNLTLSEAMKLAEKEEEQNGEDDESQVMDASPSPAPRSWRARKDAEDDKAREKGLKEDPIDVVNRSRIAKDKTKIPSPEKKTSEGRIDVRGGSRTAEAGRELAKVTGNEGNWRDKSDWRSRPTIGSQWSKEPGSGERNEGLGIPDLVPGIEDLPLPSVEGDDKSVPSWRRSSTAQKPSTSPEKSFAWQIEDDFTAGDLQVSNSPRIKTDHRPFANRLKFDESSEVDIDSRNRVNTPGSRNTRLDEIRSREVKSGSNIPIERPQSRSRKNSQADDMRENETQKSTPPTDRHLKTSNKKLEDIRKREEEGLTPRQLSQAKLEEIREQNAASRSKSPEEARPISRSSRSEGSSQGQQRTPGDKPLWRPAGEKVPGSPVAVYQTREERIAHVRATSKTSVDLDKKDTETRPGHKRADSRDLLRQLARATSSSPASDSQPAHSFLRKSAMSKPNSSSSSERRSPRRALTSSNVAARKKNVGKDAKPTVGFANLRRTKSSGSSSGSKRSSVHSEDPTDRIDAEAKLFAPKDDYSEMGSVRANSPVSDSRKDSEAEVEATPKAPSSKRVDVQALPTPRVTGAYVETPVTARSRRFESDVESNNDLIASIRARRALRRRDTDTNSEPGEDEKPSAPVPDAAPKTRRRRSVSLPRRRPPVKNSALPPSVKADLMELRRSYNIEDSTLDANFDQILLGAASPQLKSSLDDLPQAPVEEDSFDQTLREYSELPARKPSPMDKEIKVEQSEEDNDLEAYSRMSKSLRTGIMGIRTAKQGIERLEDNLTHPPDTKPENKVDTKPPTTISVQKDAEKQPGKTMSEVPASSTPITYILLPVPRLWVSKPKFRFTVLGMLVFFMGLWYAAESTMCSMYCQPTTCATTPCVWSYDDPTFGKALPIKFDQWATGGLGRSLINNAAEQAEDWVADVLDAAYGRDITEVDMEALSFEGKRAHRRRLRKKGLLKRLEDTNPEVRARWDAWHQERLSQQKARDLREMGYHSAREEDETIGGDTKMW